MISAKGYGLRDVKHNQPVTPKTLFAIGSSTKSFTVTSLGVLVDQGKLDWDKPVHEYLPDFRLMDRVRDGADDAARSGDAPVRAASARLDVVQLAVFAEGIV